MKYNRLVEDVFEPEIVCWLSLGYRMNGWLVTLAFDETLQERIIPSLR